MREPRANSHLHDVGVAKYGADGRLHDCHVGVPLAAQHIGGQVDHLWGGGGMG